MNVFNCIGCVGKDAVERFTQGGKPVTGWSLAVDNGFGDNKQTIWLDCSWWGERAGKVAQYITKGSQLGVTGELGTREHDGKTYITLNVRDVSLVGGKQDTGNGTPRSNAPKAQRRDPVPVGADVPFDDENIPFATNRGRW